MASTAIGDGELCVVPGCGFRAKDARAFCHDHWERLPNRTRRKIGKLYTSSRRGHHRNPRQAQWKVAIESAVDLLIGPQPLPTPEPVRPLVMSADEVRKRMAERPAEPEIEPTAKEAIRDLNRRAPHQRRAQRATEQESQALADRLSSLDSSQLQHVSAAAGISISTVRDAMNQRRELTQKVARAISYTLDEMQGVLAKPDDEIEWLRYLEKRLKAGKAYPTPEEAFRDSRKERA